ARGPPNGTAREEIISTAVALMSTTLAHETLFLFHLSDHHYTKLIAPKLLKGVKVLHPHIANDETARRRLARETRTLRRIRHPRIAEVLDAELDAAQPFIITEFVDGQTLSDDVRDNGPFAEDELVHFG